MKLRHGNISLALIIPMIVLSLVVAGIFMYKLYSEQTATKSSASTMEKTLPQLNSSVRSPKSGYGQVVGPTRKPTVAIGSASSTGVSLEDQIQQTVDDEGVGQFQQLQTLENQL